MRRYGLTGTPEILRRCIVEVWSGSSMVGWGQCGLKRGHGPAGLYCVKHARMLAEGRHVQVPEDKK